MAIADVDAVVFKGSLVDRHAAVNTTSVYTPGVVFPMLPERLSTDLTSLNPGEDRLAVVIEFVVAAGRRALKASDIYGARVRNHAKLAYNSVDAWLTGRGPLPEAAAAVAGNGRAVEASGRRRSGARPQAPRARSARVHDDRGAARVRRRHACAICTPDAESRQGADRESHGCRQRRHRAVSRRRTAFRRFAASSRRRPAGTASSRSPARPAIALPAEPIRARSTRFCLRRKAADPDSFPELSQTDHQAARVRRIRRRSAGRRTARPFRAGGEGLLALDGAEPPLSRSPDAAPDQGGARRPCRARTRSSELERLAAHCTTQEDAANKVERQVRKSAGGARRSRRASARRSTRSSPARRQGHVRARDLAAD